MRRGCTQIHRRGRRGRTHGASPLITWLQFSRRGACDKKMCAKNASCDMKTLSLLAGRIFLLVIVERASQFGKLLPIAEMPAVRCNAGSINW